MSNESCPLATESAKAVVENVAYAAFFWIKPTCLLFDLVGHVLCFMAFYKQSKATDGYGYNFQIFESVAKSADTLAAGLDTIIFQWCAGVNNDEGPAWFQRNYFLMWYAAHVSIALNDATTTIAIFVSLSLSVDRTLAIARPALYKQLNRRKWEAGTMAASIIIGLAGSAFVCFYFKVIPDAEKGYRVIPDSDFGSSLIAAVCVQVRNAIWMVGLIGVVGSGFCMVYFYRTSRAKIADLTSAQTDDAQEKQKRKTEKTLFILAIYDSIQAANEVSILIAHTLLAYQPWFIVCEGKLFAALRNIEIAIVNASDFYVLLLVSKRFRGIIRNVLGRNQTAVVSLQSGQKK